MADGSVRFPGFVSTGELRWLIGHCSFYACLSLDEGFGLPPVEARMLGADVLASDRPVFRETLGEHATFVDPLDPDAIGAAMRDLANGTTRSTDPAEAREDLVTRNNWSRTVAAIRERLLAGASGSRP
jgi:glycosyltransferase involved in cell wall biosynthesis